MLENPKEGTHSGSKHRAKKKAKKNKSDQKSSGPSAGKLKIGDDWHAITIIALSQSNPLKAIAEFVENSIDAKATQITLIRGKERGENYLRIVDNGQGIPRDDQGIPNFKYVATHICDSIKREIKKQGALGIQGEFGIGLLSFWTVGEELTMRSYGADGKVYQMKMKKGDPKYSVSSSKAMFAEKGTELIISPLLSGIKNLSGEKIQWYLASELRNRILNAQIEIKIIDRHARKEYLVQPKKFSGRLLSEFQSIQTSFGPIHCELYLSEPNSENNVSLYRHGTRVFENITEVDEVFQKSPWMDGYIQGLIDAPLLNLTPGTRNGMIKDERFDAFFEAIKPLEDKLMAHILEQKKAEDEKVSQSILSSIQKAFKRALLVLPHEEYDWFDLRKDFLQKNNDSQKIKTDSSQQFQDATPINPEDESITDPQELTEGDLSLNENNESSNNDLYDSSREEPIQKNFFDYPGPLHSVSISPSSVTIPVNETRTFSAFPRDKKRKRVEDGLKFEWIILEGEGELINQNSELLEFKASSEPCLTRIEVSVSQNEVEVKAEAILTITDQIIPKYENKEDSFSKKKKDQKGLPEYTFEKAPGMLWRSRYDEERNIIIINSGHKDFVYSSKIKTLKLKYILRLFAKELTLKNFPGAPPAELTERLIELLLYTEENLK